MDSTVLFADKEIDMSHTETSEVFIGTNMNRAGTRVGRKGEFAIDLRDGGAMARKNPAAWVSQAAAGGLYKVTRTSGVAPGDVDYWGRRIG